MSDPADIDDGLKSIVPKIKGVYVRANGVVHDIPTIVHRDATSRDAMHDKITDDITLTMGCGLSFVEHPDGTTTPPGIDYSPEVNASHPSFVKCSGCWPTEKKT